MKKQQQNKNKQSAQYDENESDQTKASGSLWKSLPIHWTLLFWNGMLFITNHLHVQGVIHSYQ